MFRISFVYVSYMLRICFVYASYILRRNKEKTKEKYKQKKTMFALWANIVLKKL